MSTHTSCAITEVIRVSSIDIAQSNRCIVVSDPQIMVDVFYGGEGAISGTVSEKGTPDRHVSRKVRLHRKSDGALVRTTWSDVAGNYSFSGIAMETYYVVSHDHTGNFNAVIRDNISPEVAQ